MMATSARGDVRGWARSRGLTISTRGPLSADVIAAYDQAHSGAKKGTTVPRPVAKRTAKKTASKAQPRRRAVKARPRAVPAQPRGRRPAAATTPDLPSAGTTDLAGG